MWSFVCGANKSTIKDTDLKHHNYIPRKTSISLVITDHRLQHDHKFDWDNVWILDRERHFKRLTSKMLHIETQEMSLNLQMDTEFLDHVYTSALDAICRISLFKVWLYSSVVTYWWWHVALLLSWIRQLLLRNVTSFNLDNWPINYVILIRNNLTKNVVYYLL